MTHYPISVVAPALDLIPGTNGNYVGKCPLHFDSDPSLSVKEDRSSGKLVVRCFAGCKQGAVYSAVIEKTAAYVTENGIDPETPTVSSLYTNDDEARKARRRDLAIDIWSHAEPKADVVAEYLKNRGLSGEVPDSIRQAILEYAPNTGEFYHCMVASVTNAKGEIEAIHRTFLATNDDCTVSKAAVESPKKMLGSVKRNFVQLSPDLGETAYITEGIETGLAFMEANNVTVLACLSADNLTCVELPEKVKTVIICSDLDRNGKGQQSAKNAEKRFIELGKQVVIITPKAEIPEGESSVDWADMSPEAIQDAHRKAMLSVNAPSFPWDDLKMPPGYNISKEGVFLEKIRSTGETQNVLVATGAIWLSGRRVDLATRETEIEISWMDTSGKIQARWLNRGQAFKASTILEMVELAEFPVYDGINRETVKYLALLEKHNDIATEFIVRKPGWNEGIEEKLVFVTGMDDSSKIRFHPEAAYKPHANALSKRGSIDKWLAVGRPILERFPIALFALLSVLASPLLRILNASNFLVDFWGKTSSGKTSLLKFIASVWGKPSGVNGLILSWNNTQIFSERIAAFFGQGLPIFLDDSQTANPKFVENTTYKFANGRGNGRAKPYSIKETETFQTIAHTTGERPLTENAHPGAKGRVLGVYGSPFPGIDPLELNKLKTVIEENYGHVAKAYIDRLTCTPEDGLVMLYNNCFQYYTGLSTNEIGNRFAEYFAVIRIAGEVLAHTPGMEWVAPLIDPAILQVWNNSTVDMADVDMSQKALFGLAAWTESNKRHFAVPKCQTELQPTYGMIKQDDGFVAILPHIFRQALKDLEIQSSAAVLAEWKRQGILIFAPGRNQLQVKVEGRPVWCVCIKLDALFPKTEEIQAIIPSTPLGVVADQPALPN